MGHFNQLVFNVRSFLSAVIVGCNCRRTDKNVADTDLASAVRLAVIACKAFNQHTGKFKFAVQEDVIVRDKYVIKDNQRFGSAVGGVTDIDFRTFQLSGIAALASDNHEDAFRIGRASKRYRIVFIVFPHCDGRHNDNFMRIDKTGLVRFCTTNDDTVSSPFHDMEV